MSEVHKKADKALRLPDHTVIRRANALNLLIKRNIFNAIKNKIKSFIGHKTERIWYFLFFISNLLIKGKLLFYNKNKLIDDLESYEKKGEQEIFITIPVRKIGNKNCHFDKFLEDFSVLTESPENVMIYVTIDHDDDLFFFTKIKLKYQRSMNIRFFVAPDKSGYHGTLRLHVEMLKKRPANFLVWILGSSDMKPTLENWDSNLLRCIIDNQRSAFLGGGPMERMNRVHGPNPAGPEPIYWVGTDDYPIVSKTLIDYLDTVTAKRKDGFSLLGDTWHIDGHFGELLRHLCQIGRDDFFIEVPYIFEERLPGGWHGNPSREAVRTKVLSEFFSPSKQKIYYELAIKISCQFPCVKAQQ